MICKKLLLLGVLILNQTITHADTLWIERFDMSNGPIDNEGSGYDWYSPWSTQNDALNFRVESSNLLTFPNVQTSGGYLVGGDNFNATGRFLNAYAYDSHYQDANLRIGQSGRTLFLSFLIRKNFSAADYNAPVEVVLSDSNFEPYLSEQRSIAIGYPGPDANVGLQQVWALDVFGNAGGQIFTDSVIRYDETYLMLLEISFGPTSTVNLWINPDVENIEDLGMPSASASTSENIGFWNILFNAAYGGTNHGALDEIVFYDPSYSGTSLPVDLLRFDGVSKADRHYLTWTTASEFANDGFEIQSSHDGITFEKIGWISGHGDSNELINYAHDFPAFKSMYYRLKQIDFDGKFEYSTLIYVSSPKSSSSFNIFPNPFRQNGMIHVTSSGYKQAVIHDLNGRVYHVLGESILEEEMEKILNKLKQGVYIIHLLDENGEIHENKLLVEE